MVNLPKTLLTEQSQMVLTYVKEDLSAEENKHYLGKLCGIGADFRSPTRNGRKYPYELWVNVLNSEDFKEGMETHTIFGEVDHPEDRSETSIKEVAIVLTKCELRENEGIVYTEFHILNTPNGRILKELLDYGSQIGISTRGLGDEIVKDGETIIDPDTYFFIAWDAVITPAVKSARPIATESFNKVSLTESFKKEIDSANTITELESIKRIASSVNTPDLDSIVESIDIKLKSINEGDNISAETEKELYRLASENTELKEKIESLNSTISANNIRIDRLKDRLKSTSESARTLNKKLRSYMVSSANMQTELYNSAREIENESQNRVESESKLNKQIQTLTRICERQKAALSESRAELNTVKEQLSDSLKKYESVKSVNIKLVSNSKKYHSEKIALENELSRVKSKVALTEQNSTNNLTRYKKSLSESHHTVKAVTDKYLEVKCSQEGLNISSVSGLLPPNYTAEDIDRIVAELSDRKRRYDKLPFSMQDTGSGSVILSESFRQIPGVSDEDRQTMTFLKNSMSSK